MTIGAIIFMAFTWFLVIALNVYSFAKIFKNKRNNGG